MDDQNQMMHPKDAKDKSQLALFMAGKEKSRPMSRSANPGSQISNSRWQTAKPMMAGGTTKTKRGSSSKPSRGR
jgi:hypothetical protein